MLHIRFVQYFGNQQFVFNVWRFFQPVVVIIKHYKTAS